MTLPSLGMNHALQKTGLEWRGFLSRLIITAIVLAIVLKIGW